MGGGALAKAFAGLLLACATVGGILATGSVARADDTELGATGGSVYAVRSSHIRLDAETVQAICFGNFAEYRVDFRFVNEGKARMVRLGFPFSAVVSGEHGTERPVGFQAWQNGRPLAVTAVGVSRAAGAIQGYFLHRAVFPHGATTITVSYLASASSTAGPRGPKTRSTSSAEFYCYWLHTGSTWQGPIGKAVVRYQFADTFRGFDIDLPAKHAFPYVPVTSPSNWTTPLPRTCQWQFTDFEPAPARDTGRWWWKPLSRFDVTLGYSQPMSDGSTQGRWTWSSAAMGFGERDIPALQDGYPSTCWAEGVPGPGIGQWVRTRFAKPVRLRELRIVPGNNTTSSSFREFARPKTLKALFSDGSSTLLHLRDAPTLQRFPVNVTTRSVKLVIESVYLGTEYPATCISEVEFGTERAPGYAPFQQLIADPYATGRLTAWAGPAAPVPVTQAPTSDWQEQEDTLAYTGGDLMGISDADMFPAASDSDISVANSYPAAVTPFVQPASFADVTARNPAVRLPDRSVVGEPTKVSALSYWTYEIRYASGIDLLVNARLKVSSVSLAPVLARQTKYFADNGMAFADERTRPFTLVTLGQQAVGLAKPGAIQNDPYDASSGSVGVPGQVFWSADHVSYHLYARSAAAAMAKLLAAARSMLGLPPVEVQSRPAAVRARGSSLLPLWLALAAAFGVAVAAAVVLSVRRQRSTRPAV